MNTVAIICEYNPLHIGHAKQFSEIRKALGKDTRIICLMSGNFVQRAEPAVFDKNIRAQAAILSGADLVLELPVTAAISSAEGFAYGAVHILNQLNTVDYLCFGSESGDTSSIMSTAKLLLSNEFSLKLQQTLSSGDSFASLRQKSLADIGGDATLLQNPNNILAVEYCKALLSSKSTIHPLAIHRDGNYNDITPDLNNPSSTSLRAMLPKGDWLNYVPEEVRELFSTASVHRLEWGERAILARLRAMTDAEFEALPYGSEGLWRKLMHESRKADTLPNLIDQVKSRRYTRTRISRMVLCAFLGITSSMLNQSIPYTRILAFQGSGREILREVKQNLPLIHAGQSVYGDFAELEKRCSRLYSLFLPPEETPTFLQHECVFYKP